MLDLQSDLPKELQAALTQKTAVDGLRHVREYAARFPDDVDAIVIESDLLRRSGELGPSRQAAARALDTAGRTILTNLRLCAVLRGVRLWRELRGLVGSLQTKLASSQQFTWIADLCSTLGWYEDALWAYDAAVRLDPENPRLLFNRAATRRFLGDLDGSEVDFDAVIKLRPSDGEAWLYRSEIRTQTSEANHVAALEARLAAASGPPMDTVRLHFALAKEHEDLGHTAESWRHLEAGNSLRRRHLRYDVRVDVATARWIAEAYADRGPGTHGCPSTEPIFIVGMPRTGTTLVERVIAASDSVTAAGELPCFAEALVAAVAGSHGRVPEARRDLVRASVAVDFVRLGAEYLDRTRYLTGTRSRFTDKMPLNYLYCGLILRSLPNARIIHLNRHPLATCFAIYKTLFNQGYPFSYDLAEIAAYYIAYHELMEHWRRLYPREILDVSYERLVDNPTDESKRIYAFCGLDWSPAVIDTSRGRAVVATASAAQVRRPIYHTSRDQWRAYASQLASVAQRLRDAGIAVN